MNREAEPAFERANVVLEEVRIFVQVDGLKRKFPQSFPSVGVGTGVRSNTTTAKLGASTIL